MVSVQCSIQSTDRMEEPSYLPAKKIPYTWFMLAMAFHKAVNFEEAQSWFEKTNPGRSAGCVTSRRFFCAEYPARRSTSGTKTGPPGRQDRGPNISTVSRQAENAEKPHQQEQISYWSFHNVTIYPGKYTYIVRLTSA